MLIVYFHYTVLALVEDSPHVHVKLIQHRAQGGDF